MLLAIKSYLDSLDPRLFPLLVPALIYGAYEALKKFAPAVFAKLPDRAQALPALFLAAVLSGSVSSGADFVHVAMDALFGAGTLGVMAVGTHHVVKGMKPRGEV